MSRRSLVLGLGLAVVLAMSCGGPAKQPVKPVDTQVVEAPPPPPPHDPAADPLPLWPAVKTGKLANGLTYFILPHHKPEKRAFMWLALNAGSILEDDDQKGLAHFDEHMSFNGTKRYPKQDIINYLQSIGMRFGADLNASTSFDQTIYQLEVPTDQPEFLDKGLDILRDWAGDVSYDPKEVEDERGVVREEWRTRRGAQQRISDKQSKVLFAGSRYATRDPIGELDIIDHAPREASLRFYKDWYRPDLMAVIVVGEISPEQIEKQIQAKFADLVNPAKERPRLHGEVPKADGPRVSIETDHELTATSVSITNLVPARPRASALDERRLIAERLYGQLMADRFNILRHKTDAPFLNAGVGMGAARREIDSFNMSARAKDGHIEDTLRALVAEVLRAQRHGFSAGELDRARTKLVRAVEEAEATEATASSRNYTSELVRHFLDNEYVIGRHAEAEATKRILPEITVDEMTKLVASFGGPETQVVLLSGPDGKPMPSREQLLKIIDDVDRSQIGPWEDKQETRPLMTSTPAAGTIVKESRNDKVGVTEWTLSNGARVIVKPTDYEADDVVISGSSPGGEATVSDKDYANARWATSVVEAGGLGDLDAVALGQVLTGKQVRASASIGETEEGVEASGSVKDLETMFQLLYLHVAAPRRDDQAIGVWKTGLVESLTNSQRNPEYQFQKLSAATLYKNNPRRVFPEPGELDKLDVDKAFAFYKDRFGDVSDFTFVIVGAVDLAKLRPLVETYLASLPGKNRKETEKDLGIRKVAGALTKQWKIGEAPKAQVRLDFHADESWTRDKERDMFVLGQVLSIRLRENLREDKSGVYGVGAGGSISRSPHQERSFRVSFTCDPKRVDELIKAVTDEIAGLEKDGVSSDYLDKVRETYLRSHETSLRTNAYWVTWLANAYYYGDDPALALDTAPAIARMTSDLVKATAKRYLDPKQMYEAVLMPEK